MNHRIMFALTVVLLAAVCVCGCSQNTVVPTPTPQPTVTPSPTLSPTLKPQTLVPDVAVQPQYLIDVHHADLGIIVKAADNTITGKDSLAGRSVASVSVDVPGAVSYGLEDAMAALRDGRVDAIVGDYNALYECVRANPSICKFAPNMYGVA